ncbi:MAG: NAD(P)-dependent oxidoreductase [Maricaulaceae bacterium]
MAKCSFIGLGVMGYPMAGHLVAAGHDVVVWNRTTQKAKKWASEYKGLAAMTIEDAVTDSDYICLCVGDDSDVYAVMEPILTAAKVGAVIIDHTTASDGCAKACYTKASSKGLKFIDAPISGGEAGAVNGQLTVMCGGDLSAYDQAKPIMDAYAKATKLMGPSGAGQTTKMINQICIAGAVQGLAEGVHFAQKAGLNVADVVEAIGKGAAASWQMLNRAETMDKDEFEHGFAVDWMRKDLGIALKTAEIIGADLTLAKQVDGYYAEIQEMGGGRWDTSSLLRRLTKD